MYLIVDIGNTLAKMALMSGGEVVAQCSHERFERPHAEQFVAGHDVVAAIVSSTRGDGAGVAAELRRFIGRVVLFDAATPVPIRSVYRTPETLGRDRLAAAVDVAHRFRGRDVLVVDFGTAITVDWVDRDGVYRGGCISAGLQTRFRALHDYTARLPLCTPVEEYGLQGLSTEEAIRYGVMNSVEFEIEGYIARMREKIDEISVIFTGGDAKYFAKRIKNTIFADWNPVFSGLERILAYNASEEHLD